MHLPIKVKSPNNISKWHMGFNSAFKGSILRKTLISEEEFGFWEETEVRGSQIWGLG
jgi:hypothetical protein